MQLDPYSLCTDGSSDEGLVKMNPLLVRVFDDKKGRVTTQLLDMGTCRSSTAESLFETMDKVISESEVPWENCVALGVDNTAVNVGCRNSIKTRVLQKNSSTVLHVKLKW